MSGKKKVEISFLFNFSDLKWTFAMILVLTIIIIMMIILIMNENNNIDKGMKMNVVRAFWFFFACALIIFLGSFFWLFTIFFKRRIGAGREGREGGSIINLKLISTYSISTCYHWMGPFRVSVSTEDWFCSPLWFLNCENNYAFMAIYD